MIILSAKRTDLFPLIIALICHYVSRPGYTLHHILRDIGLPIRATGVYPARCILYTEIVRALVATGAILKPDGEQMGLEKYKF